MITKVVLFSLSTPIFGYISKAPESIISIVIANQMFGDSRILSQSSLQTMWVI